MRSVDLVIAPALLSALAGCATVTRTSANEPIARAAASVDAAEAEGAGVRAESSAYLRAAREELDMAKRESVSGDPERARLLAMRARIDADLALVAARDVEARARALSMMEEAKRLEGGMP